MNHRKNKHADTVAQCRNFIAGICTYAEDICWWNHCKRKEESIKCFICENTFGSKVLLMSHRKKDHNKFVKMCTQFSQNSCRFKENDCWYKHESEDENYEDETNPKCTEKEDKEKVFQKVSEDLDPPIVDQKMSQK